MPDDAVEVVRSYGCSLGCGNPYDFVVVTVQGTDTMFLCTPCFVTTAGEMLEAMINPQNSEVIRKMAEAGDVPQIPMNGSGPRKRGHNAPAETEDPDAIERFESFVLEDELPDGFR